MEQHYNKQYGTLLHVYDVPSNSGGDSYKVRLWQRSNGDVHLTCGCTGWCIQKKDKGGNPLPRTCSHIKRQTENYMLTAQHLWEQIQQERKVQQTQKVRILQVME